MPAPTPGDLLHDVSLEQYAGIAVALIEGFPLPAILANEQIAPDRWPEADAAWKARVARDGVEGPLFTALRDKRAVAEDCLARAVAPIDADLGAWMSFLHAYGAHPAPAKLLEDAGLGLNDLSRLQRRWARRMAEDAALPKQAAELAKKGLAPLPALRVERAQLKPFPWSRGPVVVPVAPPPRVAAPADTSMAPGKLRLFSYVAIKARLAENPGREQAVLQQLAVQDFATTDAGWQAVLRDDPDLARDYQRLLGVQRAKIRAAAKQAPPAVPAVAPPEAAPEAPVRRAPSRLAGTAMAMDGPIKRALPFAKRATAGEMAAPLARQVPRRLSGTAMAFEAPVRAALPFPAAPAPPPAEPPREDPPRLTLEQHASLSCEIADAPERALEALARYQITPAEKQAADQHYAARFAGEPALRAAWDAAYGTYRAWLAANRVSR